MQLLNAISVCLILFGALNLAGVLAGQIREGSASETMLIWGSCCIVLGVLLCALANIGIRLNRIEKLLGQSSRDVDSRGD